MEIEKLERIFQKNLKITKEMFLENNGIYPQIVAVKSNGDIGLFVLETLSSDYEEKERDCKMIGFKIFDGLGEDLEFIMFMSEAWMAKVDKEDVNEDGSVKKRPPECENKMEVIIVSALTHDKKLIRATSLEIKRDLNEKAIELLEIKDSFSDVWEEGNSKMKNNLLEMILSGYDFKKSVATFKK